MDKTIELASRAYSALKAALAVVGVATLALFYALPIQRDTLLEHVPPLAALAQAESAPAAVTTAAGTIQAGLVESALEREKRVVGEFIARRYRVADEAVTAFVAAAYRAGETYAVDPLLILAVMAIESRYNPVAESGMGAKGLMQVIPKYHLEKLSDHGGEHALLDPQVNIVVGAQILREYTRRFGDLQTALQAYGGAFDDPSAQYSGKVFAEKARLEAFRQKARKPQSA